MLNGDTVLLLEEIVDRDLSDLRRIRLVLPFENDFLGIATPLLIRLIKHESLDRVLLLLINYCSSY